MVASQTQFFACRGRGVVEKMAKHRFEERNFFLELVK